MRFLSTMVSWMGTLKSDALSVVGWAFFMARSRYRDLSGR